MPGIHSAALNQLWRCSANVIVMGWPWLAYQMPTKPLYHSTLINKT